MPSLPRKTESTEPVKAPKPTPKAQVKVEKATAARPQQAINAIPKQIAKSAFRAPVLDRSTELPKTDSKVPVPRHDPTREHALVLPRPEAIPKGKQIVDVVVDPLLTKNLRAHQRTGVAFLYECVMGMKDYGGEGAILADSMGLGKTLQTVALLWTLLKQNPIWDSPPVIEKALIVCPATLVQHWRREIWKWLGKERIGVFIVESKKARIRDFTMGKSYNIMVVSYEKLRIVQDDLRKGSGVDIVIADEGHRLKSAQNKAAQAIKSLNIERRVILSGTPLQNDLEEFFAMVDFVNPGLLKKQSTFKREYEKPILRSRQPGATVEEIEQGQTKSEELAEITSNFILRRPAEILAQYLPAKTEYILWCKPTKAQSSVYQAILESPTFSAALGSKAVAFELITILKKVCNSPDLLLQKKDDGEPKTKRELMEAIPSHLLRSRGASGKLQVLDSLLHLIRNTTDDKVVLISNYTSTLDVLGELLTSMSYAYLRLDGTTPGSKRQAIVDQFNRLPQEKAFVFLLSTKAGGTGLNLIGASRLILFDLDWNPANDLQAMSRIHRDGQKKPCYIYRMVTQGAIEEKIFQRQVSKTGLADSIVDCKAAVSGFSAEELRDLFSFDPSDRSQTHKLLGCSCGGTGMPLSESDDEPSAERNDLSTLSSSESTSSGREDGVETLDLTKDDAVYVPSSQGWRSAKEVALHGENEFVERNRDSNGKARLLSLMQYAHFDAAAVNAIYPAGASNAEADADEESDIPEADSLDGVIEDQILRSALREDGGRIRWVFSKLSQ